MAYKTILTTWDGDALSEKRLDAAAALAAKFDAHVTVACFGVAPAMTAYAYGEGYAMLYADQMKAAQEEAEALCEAALPLVKAKTARGEARAIACGSESLARVMGEQSRYADLVVMSPPRLCENPALANRLLEGALFDGGAATLLVGAEGLGPLGGKAIIAWDESRQALSAMRAAMPLLHEAKSVEVVIVDPSADGGDREPGADVSLMLSRHGLDVTIAQLPSGGQPVSAVLNRHAREFGAGLMVMGAYAHNRFWENVVGGVTRDILDEVAIPTLMAH